MNRTSYCFWTHFLLPGVCFWIYWIWIPGWLQLLLAHDMYIVYMDVSENNGTPQIIHFDRVSIINHPFWGTTIFGNNHIAIHESHEFKILHFQAKRYLTFLETHILDRHGQCFEAGRTSCDQRKSPGFDGLTSRNPLRNLTSLGGYVFVCWDGGRASRSQDIALNGRMSIGCCCWRCSDVGKLKVSLSILIIYYIFTLVILVNHLWLLCWKRWWQRLVIDGFQCCVL